MSARTTAGSDPTLVELDRLIEALEQNVDTVEAIRRRAEQLRRQRAAGEAWSDIVGAESRPLVVELLSANLARLSEVGSRFRRAQARALYDEGVTMDRIATLFGVSRQRVSALLRENRPRRP